MPEEFDESWEYWQPDPEIEYVMHRNVRLNMIDKITDYDKDLRSYDGVCICRNPNNPKTYLGFEKPIGRVNYAFNEWRDCEICLERFLATSSNRGQRFCSKSCSASRRRQLRHDIDEMEFSDIYISGRLTNKQMSKVFGVSQNTIYQWAKRFNLDRRIRQPGERLREREERRKKRIEHRRSWQNKICQNCHNPFFAKQERNIFCSLKCAAQHRAKNGKIKPRTKEIDVDKFTEMYLSGQRIRNIASFFNISIRCCHRNRVLLNLPKRRNKGT